MEETVYQCPECNFNADNLIELDLHLTGKKKHTHTIKQRIPEDKKRLLLKLCIIRHVTASSPHSARF